MRDIKYRAWTGKQMFYQEDQYLASFIGRAVSLIIQGHDPNDPGAHRHESYLPNGGNISEYLMQYTGIKDRNGIEIYEGDILMYVPLPEHNDGTCGGDTYVVEWKDFGFTARWLQATDPAAAYPPNALDGADEDMEVIGNIYQHPDLLTAAASSPTQAPGEADARR